MKRLSIIILLSLFVCLLFLGLSGLTSKSYALESNYDRQDLKEALDPFEDDDLLLRARKIKEVIEKIQRGDRIVLRLVVFDTLEAVHDEIVRRAEERGITYYEVLNMKNSIPAFIGGFENQDPKVRLKSIGYLGDWVDELGEELNRIEAAVDDKLRGRIETRPEVRYGFRILKMKIVRRKAIEALKKGDEKYLVTIAPDDVMGVFLYEPMIKTILLGSSRAVRIYSVTLDPGVDPVTGDPIGDRPGRAPGLDVEMICYDAYDMGDRGEVAQYWRDRRDEVNTKLGKKSRTASAVKKATQQVDAVFDRNPVVRSKALNWPCIKAVYAGLDNRSLFIREQCSRIFLNYVAGWSGDEDYTREVTGVDREYESHLGEMADSTYHRRLAQVAWDNVKYADFFYSDSVADKYLNYLKKRYYLELDGYSDILNFNIKGKKPVGYKTKRYFTDDVTMLPFYSTETSGNYRNDVREICRVLGLSWYIKGEFIEQFASDRSDYRVDTLFNDARRNRPRDPDRGDTLEGESGTY